MHAKRKNVQVYSIVNCSEASGSKFLESNHKKIKFFNVFDKSTVCPGSTDPFYIVTYYIKWGDYFLDTRYINTFQKV